MYFLFPGVVMTLNVTHQKEQRDKLVFLQWENNQMPFNSTVTCLIYRHLLIKQWQLVVCEIFKMSTTVPI